MGILQGNPRMARGIGAPRGRRVEIPPKCLSRTTCKPRMLLETGRTEELAKTIWKTISSDSLFPSLLFQVFKNSDKHTIPVFEI